VEVGPRAILFDCNGVIIDDEPVHLELFRKVLREEGVPLSRKDYFKKYLAMDDRSCFRHALLSRGKPAGPAVVRDLVARKAVYYERAIKERLRIFPGVKSFVKRHRARFALAVVSGALRREIDWILKKAGIARDFSAVISAEDTRRGKPDPEGYLKALRKLNRLPRFRKRPLRAGECLAIEDSIHGVRAAGRAGMRALAVTNSYPALALKEAGRVVKSLVGVKINV